MIRIRSDQELIEESIKNMRANLTSDISQEGYENLNFSSDRKIASKSLYQGACFVNIAHKSKDLRSNIVAKNFSVITRRLDHLGLVAGMIRELGIIEQTDNMLGSNSRVTANVSVGECVAAMIINGLGFINQSLYLVSQFFQNKPIERLIAPHVTADALNDDALGRALDRIADVDPTRFFANIAFPIAGRRKYRRGFARLDSTTFSLEGAYEGFGDSPDDAPQLITITHGHSKQKRPDLKQIVLSIVNTGPCGMPIWSEPLSGNSSDKRSFHDTIARVRSFQRELNDPEEFCWVADSALYSKDYLLQSKEDILWVTRVPETIKEAKQLVERPNAGIVWRELDSGYKIFRTTSQYGDVQQRWLLIFSPDAYKRELITLNRHIDKEYEEMKKALWHLSNEEFACEADSQKRFDEVAENYKFHKATCQVNQLAKHRRRGRPSKDKAPESYVFKINKVEISRNTTAIENEQNSKGRFILATNDLDETKLSDEDILSEYKGLSKVERGFRFMKDPRFMLDKLFLKTPNRIAALTSIMTLCLMVYSIAEYELRQTLVKKGLTLPNQLKKEISNPTLRWVFQLLDGIAEVITQVGKTKQFFIANIDTLTEKIICLFSDEVRKIYDIKPEAA